MQRKVNPLFHARDTITIPPFHLRNAFTEVSMNVLGAPSGIIVSRSGI